MKKLVTILFFVPLFALGQKVTTHKVVAKESYSSIGRLYNINGRKLAEFNKLNYDKGLSIGQVLKIPANATVPAKKEMVIVKETQKEIAPATKNTVTGTPIYHTVAKKETLYHISTLYGKVPIADIKKWNHLTSDGVNEGTKLIVGYTKKANDVTVEEKPIPVQPKEEPKIEPVVVIEEKPVEIKPVPVKPKETPVVKPAVVKGDVNFSGGYFKNSFSGGDTDKGTADVFKSNSGWDDGKYYCLHNSAPVGSVIKISNATGKAIYAKVLDLIPDIKQNDGLLILISNAAATELGVGENKFECAITYSK